MGTKQLEKTSTEKQTKQEQRRATKKKEQSAKESTRKKEKQEKKVAKRKTKKPRLRMIPIWLRLIIILLLAFVVLIVGLMIGYGVLGDGNPKDALKIETWQHVIDIVKKGKVI